MIYPFHLATHLNGPIRSGGEINGIIIVAEGGELDVIDNSITIHDARGTVRDVTSIESHALPCYSNLKQPQPLATHHHHRSWILLLSLSCPGGLPSYWINAGSGYVSGRITNPAHQSRPAGVFKVRGCLYISPWRLATLNIVHDSRGRGRSTTKGPANGNGLCLASASRVLFKGKENDTGSHSTAPYSHNNHF